MGETVEAGKTTGRSLLPDDERSPHGDEPYIDIRISTYGMVATIESIDDQQQLGRRHRSETGQISVTRS